MTWPVPSRGRGQIRAGVRDTAELRISFLMVATTLGLIFARRHLRSGSRVAIANSQ